MTPELQTVIDALDRAKQAQTSIIYTVPGMAVDVARITIDQANAASATNAAVLAWLEYQVKKEQERQGNG